MTGEDHAERMLEATERNDFEEIVSILSEIDAPERNPEEAVTVLYAREYAEENERPGLREFANSRLEVNKQQRIIKRLVGAVTGSEVGFQLAEEIPEIGADIPYDDLLNQPFLQEMALTFAGLYAGYRIGSRFENPEHSYKIDEESIRKQLKKDYVSRYRTTGDTIPQEIETLRERLYRHHDIDLYAEE